MSGLHGSPLGRNITVPQVHWEFTSERVLTMERVHGVRIDDVKAIRGKLPLKLDHVTTLTNIDSSATSIDYRYEVTAPRSEVMKHKDRIEKTITTTARQTLQTRLLLKGGISLNYAYYDKNGSLLFRFSVKGMK